MIDSVVIEVSAGDGGNGAALFRREAFVPRGGPSGGDGGNGGSVILVADPSLNTLMYFRRRRIFKAEKGGNGAASKRSGKAGEDVEIRVPVGTEVWSSPRRGKETLLADLSTPGRRLVASEGGKGGRGNVHFASSTNQAPLLAEAGTRGESRRIRLNLKLLADVGIVGMPNAGKSSLLAAMSSARPKVADYPFTTVEPVLGVVAFGLDAFVAVDIPGLIEGAHSGIGLGDEFLKHVQRTRVLVHVVDGSENDVAGRIATINEELRMFDISLTDRPQIIAVNKLDMEDVSVLRRDIEQSVRKLVDEDSTIVFVSAVTREGVDSLINVVWRELESLSDAKAVPTSDDEIPVLRPAPIRRRQQSVKVRSDGSFEIIHERAVQIARGSNMEDWSVRVQYQSYLESAGIMNALTELGVKPGDTVRVGGLEFDWE